MKARSIFSSCNILDGSVILCLTDLVLHSISKDLWETGAFALTPKMLWKIDRKWASLSKSSHLSTIPYLSVSHVHWKSVFFKHCAPGKDCPQYHLMNPPHTHNQQASIHWWTILTRSPLHHGGAQCLLKIWDAHGNTLPLSIIVPEQLKKKVFIFSWRLIFTFVFLHHNFLANIHKSWVYFASKYKPLVTGILFQLLELWGKTVFWYMVLIHRTVTF